MFASTRCRTSSIEKGDGTHDGQAPTVERKKNDDETISVNNRLVLLFCALFQTVSLSAFSQHDTIRLGRSSGLQLSGSARIDYFYDTRQTFEAVEGLATIYPLNKQLDANGVDLNAAPKANVLSIATYLSTQFYAPDVFGAKSTAYIEFDFTGTSNTNGVRLRQAYANLSWTKTNLLVGRSWHPLSISCFPTTVAFNCGAPFRAFNRSDQVRFDFRPEHWLLSLFALYQSDYASLGPVPGTASSSVKSSTYLRDAVWPELAVLLAYKTPHFQAGVVGALKSIKPRLYTMSDYTNPNGARYKTDETLTTCAVQAYAQYQMAGWTLKAQATYTQNTTESLMIGGYAVSVVDPATGHEQYTPTQYMNYWINADYGKRWQAGLFAGYLNSLGTVDNVTGAWYARAHDMKYMVRISPHLFYNVNNWQYAIEFDYSVAGFGEVRNSQKASITNVATVANFRTNLQMRFYF